MLRAFFLSLVLLTSSALAQDSGEATGLAGTWQVDLRPTPDAAPYYQTFTVTALEDGNFAGTFYGTEFTDGRINDEWDTLHFAFETADGNTAYHHSGRLVGDRLEGMTFAPGRQFLAVWTATRVVDEAPAD